MSDWDGEVVGEVKRLTLAQEKRLMRMTALLRDPINLHQVLCIKQCIADEQTITAKAMWSEFTGDEQRTLWVAPSKGGIFTTAEREALHYERKKA